MTRALLGVSAAAVVWTVAVAQVPQQVFRTGTVFVNVDAYPRRDGRVVEGLTKADFEIKEDGKLQTVEALEFVRVAPYSPEAELRDPNTVEDSFRQARDPRNRVFVIYLDLFHTTPVGSFYAREPLLDFLRRSIGPNDLFGALTPEVPVTRLTFARLGETLASDLVRYWPWGEDRQVPPERDPEERRRRATSGVRPDHRSRGRACPGVSRRNHRQQPRLAGGAPRHPSRPAEVRPARDRRMVDAARRWCRRPGAASTNDPHGWSGTDRPADDGQRHRRQSGSRLVRTQRNRLAQVDYAQRFLDLITAAQRANVVFYPSTSPVSAPTCRT